MKTIKKKHIVVIMVIAISIILACGSATPQNESTSSGETLSPEVTAPSEQNAPQVNEQSPTTIPANKSPIQINIYEYAEGITREDSWLPKNNGWKPYHIRFQIIANQSLVESDNLRQQDMDNGPYIVTTDGNTYKGMGSIDASVLGTLAPVNTSFYLFPGIPVGLYLTGNGNFREFVIDFSVPEKLTPQKLVIPYFDYSIELPPLGTLVQGENSLQTSQLIDFPGSLAIDSDVTIKVSDFQIAESHIVINYQMTNNNITGNAVSIIDPTLVDSYGYITNADENLPYTECQSADYGNLIGPGQSISGSFCFNRIDYGKSLSFYVLYFSKLNMGYMRTLTLDNKAFIIKP